MANKPNRTPSGDVSQAAREKYGNSQGAFPVFDKQSAEAAIQLRGHAPAPNEVLNKVNRWATTNGDQAIKDQVAAARKVDRRKK